MKKTEIRCPRCNSIQIIYTTKGNIFHNNCNKCGYQWEQSQALIEVTRHSPLELKEHAQYLKDGTKLTNQDKYDLQIDLWQYGKEEIK